MKCFDIVQFQMDRILKHVNVKYTQIMYVSYCHICLIQHLCNRRLVSLSYLILIFVPI